ncbi:MAG: mandelate racemase [Planctomycetes bacterium]|nr:mandelate racemase [Planctomycetota bacterium]
MATITRISARDVRYRLKPGEGVDAVHSAPVYCYATTYLHTDKPGVDRTGCGIVLTVGAGNELICQAVEMLAGELIGRDIEELMSDFGAVTQKLADHPQLRWVGPHKGVVHLALASIVNACFDLWAKSRGVPLWSLLLSLTPEQIVALLDLSYLEDVLTRDQALAMLRESALTSHQRLPVLETGYPGYDTSVGWFNYTDEQVRDNARRAVGEGFTAMKLKVGSKDPSRDVRRVKIVRDAVGPNCRVMIDCNQQWTLPTAIRVCLELAPMDLYWVEEPTHPDDVAAHQTLARAIAPTNIAMGEHVPNRVVFKNYIQAQAAHFIQVDCTRVAGMSEFIAVSLLARKYGLKVVPHVGDMGQIHQHLVLFNHIALGLDRVFLEYIPHLREHFVHPAIVEQGVYRTPMDIGSSSDFVVA